MDFGIGKLARFTAANAPEPAYSGSTPQNYQTCGSLILPFKRFPGAERNR